MASRASSNSSRSASGSYGSSSSGTNAGDEIVDTSRLKSATTSADSCMWYANSECTKPRSCFDCLNVAIPSGEVSASLAYILCCMSCTLCVRKGHVISKFACHSLMTVRDRPARAVRDQS